MTRYCSQCGRPSEDSISFCPDCGTELDRSVKDEYNPSKKEKIDEMQSFAIGTIIFSIGFPYVGIVLSILLYRKANENIDMPNREKYKKIGLAGIIISLFLIIFGIHLYIN